MGVVFRALGDVGVEVDGKSLRLRPQERALLALLMCDSNRPVPAEALMHHLWRGSPPASGRTALRVHVDRIRSSMRSHNLSRLVSGDHAYRLVVEPGEFDADEVARAVQWARTMASDKPDLVANRLRAALGLWQGKPFPGIDDIEPVESARRSYESSWVDLVGLLADVELSLGRHREIRRDVLGWSAALPYSEHLATAAALAHYRCGDHVEALDLLRAFTHRLDEELGLEPSVSLRQLETAILNHSPSLAPPTLTDTLEQGAQVGLPGFQDDADRLARILAHPPHGRGCIVVLGQRGSGKSTLLQHFSRAGDARRVRHPHIPGSGLAELEQGLGIHPQSASPTTPGQAAPHVSRALDLVEACRTHDVRVLVIDDIALLGPDDVAVLRAVLELQGPRPTLLTSARSITSEGHPLLADAGAVADSVTLELGPRDLAACRALLSEVLPTLTSPEDDVIKALAARSGGNPALLVALARDAAYGDDRHSVPATVSEYVARLLDQLTPGERELALLAALDTTPTIDVPIVVAAASESVGTVLDPVVAMESLIGEGLLVDAPEGPSFRIDLVRDVVAASASSSRRRAAHTRLAKRLLTSDTSDVARVAHHLRSAEAPELILVTAEFAAREGALLAARGEGIAARERFLYAARMVERQLDGLALALSWELDACAADVMLGMITSAQARAAAVSTKARSAGLPRLFARAAVMSTGPWRPTGREQAIAAALTEEALTLELSRVDDPAASVAGHARNEEDAIDRVALLEACVRAHAGHAGGASAISFGTIRDELEAAATSGSPRRRALALRGLHSLAWRDSRAAGTRGELSGRLVVWSDLSDWGDLHLEALRLRCADALEEGRPEVLSRCIRDYTAAALAAHSPLHLWWSAILERTQCVLRGDAEGADRAQAVADAHAGHVDPDLRAAAALEQAFAAALSGGSLDSLPSFDAEESSHDVATDPVVECALLLVRAALVGDVTATQVESVRSGTVGTSREVPAAALAAMALAHVPRSEDRDDVGRHVLACLAPHAGGLVTVNGAAHFGPIDTHLATLYAMLGDTDQARVHHADAASLLESFTRHP